MISNFRRVLIVVFKIPSAFYPGFTTKGLKISFPAADVSTGKITLYHVTRCPQAAGCAGLLGNAV
jgi:hypothetical protein